MTKDLRTEILEILDAASDMDREVLATSLIVILGKRENAARGAVPAKLGEGHTVLACQGCGTAVCRFFR